jgi:hypothetical protein
VRRWRAALLLLAAASAQAAPDAPLAEDGWLASAAARAFRERVVALAVLYDSAAGIDPRGLRVEAARTGTDATGCPQIQVTTSRDGAPLRRETVAACPPVH